METAETKNIILEHPVSRETLTIPLRHRDLVKSKAYVAWLSSDYGQYYNSAKEFNSQLDSFEEFVEKLKERKLEEFSQAKFDVALKETESRKKDLEEQLEFIKNQYKSLHSEETLEDLKKEVKVRFVLAVDQKRLAELHENEAFKIVMETSSKRENLVMQLILEDLLFVLPGLDKRIAEAFRLNDLQELYSPLNAQPALEAFKNLCELGADEVVELFSFYQLYTSDKLKLEEQRKKEFADKFKVLELSKDFENLPKNREKLQAEFEEVKQKDIAFLKKKYSL